MRIVQIITRSDSVGGAQMHVCDLSVALIRAGHEVTVLVGGEGPFVELLRKRGVACRPLRHLVRPIRPFADWRAFWEIRRELKRLRPDLVATHSSKAGWLGRLAGRSLGIPTVFTAHGWAFTEGVPERTRRFYIAAEKLASRLATKIISVSGHDFGLALKHRVASPDKLVTIRNGVPDMKLPLAQPEADPPLFLMTARFEPQKDHATLLQALASLADRDWRLALIGDGPLRAQMEAEADRLGLGEKVNFLGERRDVGELLSSAQCFLLISKWEGLPLSILEAMRAGLPVVASDVGGVKEIVADGETGFLVARGDAVQLRRRIEQLLQQPELRRRMGRAGRRLYEERFTDRHMIANTLSVYEQIVKRGG